MTPIKLYELISWPPPRCLETARGGGRQKDMLKGDSRLASSHLEIPYSDAATVVSKNFGSLMKIL